MSNVVVNIIQACFDTLMLTLLLLSAFSDAKTRTISGKLQLSMLVVSVAHLIFEFIAYPNDLWGHPLSCLITGSFIFIMYIVMVLIMKDKTQIGGADTKISSIMGLYLGLDQMVCSVIVHTLTALCYAGYNRYIKKKIVKSVPLMVYMTIGFVVTKIIYWIVVLL